jgi:hypothetical protein
MRWFLAGFVLVICSGCWEFWAVAAGATIAGFYVKEPDWPAPERELKDPVGKEVLNARDPRIEAEMIRMEKELRGPICSSTAEINKYRTGAYTPSSTYREPVAGR